MATYPFPAITPSASSWSLESNAASFVSPFTGATQTIDRSGERWRVSMTFNNLNDADKARMQSFLTKLNGTQHRFWLEDHSYTQRGSITVTEMLDVTFNATNWINNAGQADRGETSDIDQGIRWECGIDSNSVVINPTSLADGISPPTEGGSYSVTLNFHNALASSYGATYGDFRVNVRDATWGNALENGNLIQDGASGRSVVSLCCTDNTAFFPRPHMNASLDASTGTSIDMTGLSVARALQVDNGVNEFPYSEEFDQADWSKTRTSISANAAMAPDGTTTADELIEDSTASASHHIQKSIAKSAANQFWTFSIYVKRDTDIRDIRLKLQANAGANYTQCTFDLGAGTAGSVTDDGSQFSLGFASIHDVGNNWYRCRLTARTDTDTVLDAVAFMSSGGSISYTGDGSSYILIWGAQLQQGSQLGRYVKTSGTATSGTSQTGRSIWVKGLDSDTDGQLLPGDRVEINGQLCMVTADLDGNESGVGLMQVTPGIRTATTDEDAVVLHKPHGKFMLAGKPVWRNTPGGFGSFTVECIEDIT